MDTTIKIAARTKVNLKITFSRPLLVKEAVLPQALPNPVPFDWMRITTIRMTEVII
jgi:hypothetical protein